MPKYLIRATRFINGVLVHATPDQPAIIELPEGAKVDRELYDPNDPGTRVALKPHYVERKRPDGRVEGVEAAGAPPSDNTNPSGLEPAGSPGDTSKEQGHGAQEQGGEGTSRRRGNRASDRDV